jgi:hypothetical protein
MRSGPGPEATVFYFAAQLGACLTEMGLHYDLLNEVVIPAVEIAAPADFPSSRRHRARHRAGAWLAHLPRTRALPAPASGAIMNLP